MEDKLYFVMPNNTLIRNPSLPAIHGGVIGGFMELSAAIELLYNLDIEKIPQL